MFSFRCDVERGAVGKGRRQELISGVRYLTSRVFLETFPDVYTMKVLLIRYTLVSTPSLFCVSSVLLAGRDGKVAI